MVHSFFSIPLDLVLFYQALLLHAMANVCFLRLYEVFIASMSIILFDNVYLCPIRAMQVIRPHRALPRLGLN